MEGQKSRHIVINYEPLQQQRQRQQKHPAIVMHSSARNMCIRAIVLFVQASFRLK